MSRRLEIARASYGAYESGDRTMLEEILSDDFTFFAPPDPGIDRVRYFERCWPNAELIESFEFKRLVEVGDEDVVTYESTKTDGNRFRNTEILTFDGVKICKAEVYFGGDLPCRKEPAMGTPVVHFEIMGGDGERLKSFYADLFGWKSDSNNPMNHGM